MTPPSDGFRTRIALVCQPDTRRLRTAASLLALALHSPFPAFPISPLGEQDFPGALPAMPVLVTALLCCLMGSDKANMESREKVSAVIAQTSSVCEGGSQTLSSWRLLTFRNTPKCHI